MGLLLVLTIAAPIAGAAVATLLPERERAVNATRTAALVASACWFALLVDGSVVSVSRLHSAPLVAAAGCGAALVAAAVDASAVERPALISVALAATSVALAAGRTTTDGIGVIAALVVAVGASVAAARPSVRVAATAGVGLALAAAGVLSLRSATNSWQLPLTDAAANHRGDGLLILIGAALLVLAATQQTRRPVALLVPAGVFLAAQAAPLVHRADGLASAAVVLAAGAAAVALAPARLGQAAFNRPAAALTLVALAAFVAPGAARGPALLLAAAGTLACALEWPGVAALGVPGGVALAIALASRGGTTAFVVGVLVGVVALALAAAAAREEAAPRPAWWTAPALVLGAWLLVAPGTWGWVGPVSLHAYDIGAARALAGAALCLIVLVHLGRDPSGWYAHVFPPDSPGEDAVRH